MLKSSLKATLLLCLLSSVGYAKRVPNLEFKDLAGHPQKLATLQRGARRAATNCLGFPNLRSNTLPRACVS